MRTVNLLSLLLALLQHEVRGLLSMSLTRAEARSRAGGAIKPASPVYKDEARIELDVDAMIGASDFPLTADQLIARAKEVLGAEEGPLAHFEDLADDFVFMGPVIGPLTKEEYIPAVTRFSFSTVLPDLSVGAYNFHVDPYEPNRVYYCSRSRGTYSGDQFALTKAKPSGQIVQWPPSINQMVFNAEGKVTCFSPGYVIDNNVGTTGGLTLMFGFLQAVGTPLPFPEAKPYKKSWQFSLFQKFGNLASKLQQKPASKN